MSEHLENEAKAWKISRYIFLIYCLVILISVWVHADGIHSRLSHNFFWLFIPLPLYLFVYSVSRGWAPVRFGQPLSRDKDPIWFWTLTGIYFGVSLLFFLKALQIQ